MRPLCALAIMAVATAAVATGATATGAAPRGWTVTALTDVGGAAWAIDAQGSIAGDVDGEPFLWRNGSFRSLGQLPQTYYDWSCGMNDRGAVVGNGWGPEEMSPHAFVWTGGRTRAVGTTARESEACGINDRGQVVGWRDVDGTGRKRAFVWSGARLSWLATPAGMQSEATAVNDSGLIVGYVAKDGGNRRPVIWLSGKRVALRTLAGGEGSAVDVNARAQVVGWSTAQGGVKHAVIWGGGRIRDLGVGFEPRALNDTGQVVGTCAASACIWENGKRTTLPGMGLDDVVAADVNERGQVVGWGFDDCGGDCRNLSTALVWARRP